MPWAKSRPNGSKGNPKYKTKEHQNARAEHMARSSEQAAGSAPRSCACTDRGSSHQTWTFTSATTDVPAQCWGLVIGSATSLKLRDTRRSRQDVTTITW
jgi:hypothetical protein